MKSVQSNNHKKPLLFLYSILIIFVLTLVVFPVDAADEDTVTATVTVQNISVSVSDGAVAYGILALNTSAGTNGSDTQTAENDGNVTVDLNIRGSNTADWTLAGSNGANQYIHRFCTTTCGTAPTNYTALTTSYATLTSGVTPSGTQTFDLYITTPTSTVSYLQQNANITVQAVLP